MWHTQTLSSYLPETSWPQCPPDSSGMLNLIYFDDLYVDVESSDRWFVNSLLCRVLSLASCASGQALLCKEVRISIASWRNLCPNQTLEPEVSNFTSFGELTGLDVCCGKYSKHPWSTVWTWCQSQSSPEFCRSFEMVAARPQEDRLQEVFEEWRCQHDRINTSAEYCVRQAGGLQMPDTLSHITSYTWTPRTWNSWAWQHDS